MVSSHARLTGKAPVFFLMLVAAGLSSSGQFAPCRAQTAALTPAQRAAALAGAQQVIQSTSGAKSNAAFAELLTRQSAASLGAFFLALSDMTVSFSQMPGANSIHGILPAKLKKDYDALLARWSMTEKVNPPTKGTNNPAPASLVAAPGVPVNRDGVPLLVEQHGRRFLVDVLAFMAETDPKNGFRWKGNSALSVSDFTYTVLSPTRVGLKMKKPSPKSPPPAAAVFEDGKWRLDLGDVLKKSP